MATQKQIEANRLNALKSTGPSSFLLLQRRIDSVERSYYRALNQLQRIRRGADPAPAPEPLSPDGPLDLASFFPVPPPPEIPLTSPAAPSPGSQP